MEPTYSKSHSITILCEIIILNYKTMLRSLNIIL